MREYEATSLVLERYGVRLGIGAGREQQRPTLTREVLRELPCVESLNPHRDRVVIIAARREVIRRIPEDLLVRAAKREDSAAILS